MRIAQIAPLAESVPPRLYGGTERVVAYRTEELVRLGHQVTPFASGDSASSARLVPCTPRALRHFHIEPPLHLPLFRPLEGKTVTTLHGRLDLPDLQPLLAKLADMPLVSISDSQRAPAPALNWLATVYHGLSPRVCPCSPEKGLDRAACRSSSTGSR